MVRRVEGGTHRRGRVRSRLGCVRFFVDNCLAPRHAAALDALLQPDHQVVHLRTHFPQDVSDEEWLSSLGEDQGWVVISADNRIFRNPHLQQVWRQSGLTAVFLKPAWQKLTLLDQHSKLSAFMPKIIAAVKAHRRGTGFTLSVNGKIDRLSKKK